MPADSVPMLIDVIYRLVELSGAGHRREQNKVVVLAGAQYERLCHLEKSDGPTIRRQTQGLHRTIAQR